MMSKSQADKEKFTVVFICTGNICRSPMAASSLGSRIPKILKNKVIVISAGIRAWNGFAPTVEAELTARLQGYDMSQHRSRSVDESIIRKSDLIICMENEQKTHLLNRFPGILEKTFTLNEFADRTGKIENDVEDPYGKDIDAYKSTMSLIDHLLNLSESKIWKMARKKLKI